jgi:hypothetical protein
MILARMIQPMSSADDKFRLLQPRPRPASLFFIIISQLACFCEGHFILACKSTSHLLYPLNEKRTMPHPKLIHSSWSRSFPSALSFIRKCGRVGERRSCVVGIGWMDGFRRAGSWFTNSACEGGAGLNADFTVGKRAGLRSYECCM